MLRAQAAIWLDWLLLFFKHSTVHAPQGRMQSPEVRENQLLKRPFSILLHIRGMQ